MKDDVQYGVINEIGDMGLGFDEVTDKENKQINEAVEKQTEEKEEE